MLRAWRRQALEGAVLFASSAVSGSSCHHQAVALLLSAALYADEQGRDPHHGILHSDGRSGAPHCAGTPCCSDPSRWTRYRCAFPYQRCAPLFFCSIGKLTPSTLHVYPPLSCSLPPDVFGVLRFCWLLRWDEAVRLFGMRQEGSRMRRTLRNPLS